MEYELWLSNEVATVQKLEIGRKIDPPFSIVNKKATS
jgi:hypothetical protein